MFSSVRCMSRAALLELHLANLLLSCAILFTRWIDAPVPFVIASRCLLAGLALYLLLKLKFRQAEVLDRRATGLLIVSGALLALHWMTFFYSGRISTIALAMVAMYTYPLMTALVEPFLEGGFRLDAYKTDLLLALLATAGIAWIGLSATSVDREGLLWGLLSAALITARNLIVRRKLAAVTGSRIMMYQVLVAALLLSPLLVYFPLQGYRPGLKDLLLLLALSLIVTALAHTLYTRALLKMPARTTGIISSVQPLYSAVAAFLFFQEVPGWATVGGGTLVLIAASIESLRFNRRQET